MTDIAKRLRHHVKSRLPGQEPVISNGAWAMMLEGADEIERLRAALKPFADYADIVGPDDPSPAYRLTGETPIVPTPSDQSGVDPLRVKHLREARTAMMGSGR